MKILLACTFLMSLLGASAPYKILALFPYPGNSHYVMFQALLKELAQKGHEIDVLNHFPQEKPVSGFTDLSMRGTMEILKDNTSITFVRTKFKNRFDMMGYMIEKAGIHFCELTFNAEVVRKLRNTTKKYDLVITEIYSNDCMLGFGHHFKVPVVSMTSSVNIPWGSDRFGNPDNPSYIPNYFLPYLGSMSFMQRLDNTLTLLLSKIWYSFAQRRATSIARKFFGNDLPDLEELAFNTSLHLVNSHFSLNNARPNVPGFVEVGGLHIKLKKLPQHLENILNVTATQKYKGVIVFSMGSMVLTETLDRETLTSMFEAFSELPYQVVWKATKAKMPADIKIPSNIHFESWLPQTDVLCHPDVKLFITHGGLMGTQEATYCGVPCLGIPLFGDQVLNIKALEANGLARMLHFDDLDKQNILKTLKELLDNPKYKTNADLVAHRFRDRPLSPLDTAVYWVEYVIRHHGAPHLRSSGTDLPWYQYHLLDVGAIFILIALTIFFIIYRTIILLMRMARGSKKTQKQKAN